MRGVNHVLRLLLRLASGSSLILFSERFLLRQKKNRRIANTAMSTTPPTAIPIMAPVGSPELEDDPDPDPDPEPEE